MTATTRTRNPVLAAIDTVDETRAASRAAALAPHAGGIKLGLVVPGIRPAGAAAGDQKRVMTPAEALASGADYLVIGRPPAEAGDAAAGARAIAAELAA